MMSNEQAFTSGGGRLIEYADQAPQRPVSRRLIDGRVVKTIVQSIVMFGENQHGVISPEARPPRAPPSARWEKCRLKTRWKESSEYRVFINASFRQKRDETHKTVIRLSR
jgi:hypothetical protein